MLGETTLCVAAVGPSSQRPLTDRLDYQELVERTDNAIKFLSDMFKPRACLVKRFPGISVPLLKNGMCREIVC